MWYFSVTGQALSIVSMTSHQPVTGGSNKFFRVAALAWGQDEAAQQTEAEALFSLRPPVVTHDVSHVTGRASIRHEPILTWTAGRHATRTVTASSTSEHPYWLDASDAAVLLPPRVIQRNYKEREMSATASTSCGTLWLCPLNVLPPNALIKPLPVTVAMWSTLREGKKKKKVLRWQLWSFAQPSALRRLRGASPSLPLSPFVT